MTDFKVPGSYMVVKDRFKRNYIDTREIYGTDEQLRNSSKYWDF
jgi:hypothetical protein